MKKEKKKMQETEDLQEFNFDEERESAEEINPCDCEDECQCKKEDCTCEENCTCDEHHDCGCNGKGEGKCHCHETQQDVNEYLLMAQRLQADFENYRRRVSDQLTKERQEGTKDAVEVFLPCLDTFKEAKKSISDEGVLAGVNMIENKILQALKTLKVEKIEAIGQKFDPHLHNVIAAYADESQEDGVVLEEYQSGWTMDGKVIRYSKVVVNKR